MKKMVDVKETGDRLSMAVGLLFFLAMARGSQLRRSELSSEDSHGLASSPPGSECWSEEDKLRAAVLLRSGGGRR